MSLILFLGELIFGCLLGFVIFSLILLPLFYGFPKSLYWSIKGKIRYFSAVFYFLSAVIWAMILFGFVSLFFSVWPSGATYLAQSNAFTGGFWAGLLISGFRALFTTSARNDIKQDFMTRIAKHTR